MNEQQPVPDAPPAYRDAVPAVSRAIRVLERLAATRAPQSLADLARALGVGPSSLLAILTTLRHAQLVRRDRRGRYQLGAGLAALGGAALAMLRAGERFAVLADDLVAAAGETALLWVRQDDVYVLAAAREGCESLRYVPPPGLRLARGGTALDRLAAANGVVEQALEPGVTMVAVRLPTGADETACLALAGPAERLAAPAVRRALLAAAHDGDAGPVSASGGGVVRGRAAAPAAVAPADLTVPTAPTAGPIEGDELDRFLRQGLVATLSYLDDGGFPATVPLWYAWDGTDFWLVSRPGSEWVEHVRLDPRVSLAVSESSAPLRRVLARGRMVEMAEPCPEHWAAVEQQLSARYAGFDAVREPSTAAGGRLLRLRPERLIAWRGLLRHPRLPPEPPRPKQMTWRHIG